MRLQDLCSPASLAAGFARNGGFPFPSGHIPRTPAAQRRLAAAVARARELVAHPQPHLTASSFIRFMLDGNRIAFEDRFFLRRNRLGVSALAWAATGEAIFATDVADAVWMICEESSWCLPAHFHGGGPTAMKSHLPQAYWPGMIDLFACETAHCLAEACQFAGAAISQVDPGIIVRACTEIRHRVLDPIAAGVQPWWWDGSNNWGPWCASSLICAAGFVLRDDPAAWGRQVHEQLGVIDRYLARQGDDGGCDEGVGYWNVAGGAAVRAIEEIALRSGWPEDPWRDARLRAVACFPARMHLGAGAFPAIGDTTWRSRPWTGILARSSAVLAEPGLLALARSVSDPVAECGRMGTGDLLQDELRALWWFDTAADGGSQAPADAWLPDLQLMVAHGGGTSLVVKGGHNDENHNHCDIGQFIVHRHGVPLLVDAGRGDYTAQTFGPKRYELWWTRGSGHAVPQIGGHEQLPGRERAARAVACTGTALELDLAGCYPAELGLRGLLRRVALERPTGAVRLSDRIDAATEVDYALALLLTAAPKPVGDRAWSVESGGQRLLITAEAPLAGSVEAVELDATLRGVWGALWRLTLRGRFAPGAVATIRIEP